MALRKGGHLRRDARGLVVWLDGKGIEGVTIERGQWATPPTPHLTLHDLRATFITLALEGKAPLQAVQYAARHKGPILREVS